jgi:hypothetical protein
LGVVVWIDEVVFIKSKGNADDADCGDMRGFGGSDLNISFPSFENITLLFSPF